MGQRLGTELFGDAAAGHGLAARWQSNRKLNSKQ
nr:MAG TPA: hypothetical protein [Caudoviricetes sp.]